MLKNKLKSEAACFTHDEFLEAISRYLGSKMPVMNSDDAPECCVCGGRKEVICHCIRDSTSYKAVVDEQQKQLLVLSFSWNFITSYSWIDLVLFMICFMRILFQFLVYRSAGTQVVFYRDKIRSEKGSCTMGWRN